MNKVITATEAKNQFGQLLEDVRDGPVAIQKNGRDVAVLISREEYDLNSNRDIRSKLFKKLHQESMQRYESVYRALAK